MNPKSVNRIIAVILFAGSALWGCLAAQFPESFVKGVPGPSFFPLTIVAALMVLSVCLFFSKGESKKSGTNGFNWRQVAVISMMCAYVAIIPYAGFPLTTMIALFTLLVFSKKIGIGSAILTSAITTGILFLIFKLLLKIPLPSGEWFA